MAGVILTATLFRVISTDTSQARENLASGSEELNLNGGLLEFHVTSPTMSEQLLRAERLAGSAVRLGKTGSIPRKASACEPFFQRKFCAGSKLMLSLWLNSRLTQAAINNIKQPPGASVCIPV